MIAPIKIKKSKTHNTVNHHFLPLEAQTELAALRDRKVLALLDEQNLTITARHLGYRVQYDLLAKRILKTARSARIHIFIASEPSDESYKTQLERSGYITHTKTIRRKVVAVGKIACDSNIDNIFAFWTGVSVSRITCDVVVLGSGDYGVAGELAEAINRHRKKAVKIMTLSLPTSTSGELDAQMNPNISANLEIGLDLLKPSAQFKRQNPPFGINNSALRNCF